MVCAPPSWLCKQGKCVKNAVQGTGGLGSWSVSKGVQISGGMLFIQIGENEMVARNKTPRCEIKDFIEWRLSLVENI